MLAFYYGSNAWIIKGKSESTSSEFLHDVVEVSKENTCDKSPTIHFDKNRQKKSANIVVVYANKFYLEFSKLLHNRNWIIQFS